MLVLLCSNSAPPLSSKCVDEERLPIELLDAAKLEGTFLNKTLGWMKEQNLDKSPSHAVVFGHDDFRVVVVTKFERDDYREFLEKEMPLDLMQPIIVGVET